MSITISKELLSVLACPISGEPLSINENGKYLFAQESRNKYQIKNGIPVLISEFSESLDEEAGYE